MQFIGLHNFLLDRDAFLYQFVNSDSAITNIKLSSGILEAFYVSSNPDTEQYDNGLPEWDDDTIMRTDFINTCSPNRSQIDLQAIDGLAIKKRKKINNAYDGKWETIYIQPVENRADFNFTFTDYLCKNNCDYQYNIVPVANGIETYTNNVKEVHSSFNGIYFTDGHMQYGTPFDVQSNYSRKTSSSTVQPINSRYPVTVKNGLLNYSSGSITSRFLKMNDDDTADTDNGYSYRKEVIDFLAGSPILVFKNYDGFIGIISIENDISEDFGEHYLAPKLSFSWVQVGDAEDYEQLKGFGLIQSGDDYDYEYEYK